MHEDATRSVSDIVLMYLDDMGYLQKRGFVMDIPLQRILQCYKKDHIAAKGVQEISFEIRMLRTVSYTPIKMFYAVETFANGDYLWQGECVGDYRSNVTLIVHQMLSEKFLEFFFGKKESKLRTCFVTDVKQLAFPCGMPLSLKPLRDMLLSKHCLKLTVLYPPRTF